MNDPFPCGCRQWNQAWIFCRSHSWGNLPGSKPAPPSRVEDRSGHGRDLVSPSAGGRTWKFDIPIDVNEASQNNREKRGLQHHLRVKREHRTAGRQAWLNARCPRTSGKVRVSAHITRRRKADIQNLIGAMKHLCDGLFTAALTDDDGPDWVTFGEVTLTVDRTAAPSVVLTVEEV